MDGLGGLPREVNGPTELEHASTPNLDRCGRRQSGPQPAAGTGVTPGSGPGHLALFDTIRWSM